MISTNPPEEWRTITHHPNYDVSNRGRVRSRQLSNGPRRWLSFPTRILRGTLMQGYRFVKLHDGESHKSVGVHVLVCEAFNGPRPSPEMQCAHWNGDRLDNTPDNLRWATAKENHMDARRHGTAVRGVKCHTAKLTESKVRCIRKMWASRKYTQREIAHRFGVTRGNISWICRGDSWKHVK